MNTEFSYRIRSVKKQDRSWVAKFIARHWGEDYVVVHEDIFSPEQLPGFIAITPKGKKIGLVTYQIREEICEIITLNSLIPNQGVGTKLVEAVLEEARRSRCSRICLTTTNNNQRAIDFYKGRGFYLHEVRKGAVNKAREIKPSIPFQSPEDQSITDEWVFSLDII